MSEKSPNYAVDAENGLLTSKPYMDTKSYNLAAYSDKLTTPLLTELELHTTRDTNCRLSGTECAQSPVVTRHS